MTVTSTPTQPSVSFGDDPSAEHAWFRARLCEFLRAELGERLDEHRDPTQLGGVTAEFRRALMRRLGAEGFLGMGWPAEYGGGGRDYYYDLILAEEMEYHGGPPVEPSYLYVPFTLVEHGTEEQKREFLPQLRAGSLSIIVGYTEPEAGSDLANLSATAKPVEGGYLLTGDKVFQSYATTADYSLAVARTSPRTEKKHRGLSLMLVDMRAGGVWVHEHRTMAGFFHESVHFEDVFVPADRIVGPLDGAWRGLMGAIGHERAMLGASGQADRQIDEQVKYLGSAPWDPHLADELIQCAIDAEAAKLYSREVAVGLITGADMSDQSGVSLLLKRELVRRLESTGIDLLQFGAENTALDDGIASVERDLTHWFLEDFVYEFSAGGFDITRNIIAQRILGLPR